MRFMTLVVGEGRNNFIVEWNDNRDEELASSPIPENTLSEDEPTQGKNTKDASQSATPETDPMFPDQPSVN